MAKAEEELLRKESLAKPEASRVNKKKMLASKVFQTLER